MHESYQPRDEEARNYYDYYHNAYRNNNWDHLSKCRCQYGAETYYPSCSTSDYHSSCSSSYCGWGGCQNSYIDDYEQSDQSLGAYNTTANARHLNLLNSVGNEDKVKYLSTRSRWYPTRRRHHNRYINTTYNNEDYCTWNRGVTSEISSTTTPEMSEHPRGGHVAFNIPECSIIDDRSNNNTSTSLGNDSFHSCLACNSCQIETVFENKGHMSSKSTINHGSNPSLDGQASGVTFARDTQRQRRKVNSGYYEFVSPTRIKTRSTPQTRALNSSKKQTNSIGTDVLKRSIRYGYFEVKERGYSGSKCDHERISFFELDKIPTKMSKQIDTTHFKESTMIDKSLSAHLGHASGVKTSNKSLLANIAVKDRKILTQSDITKIINKLMKSQTLEVKGSSKIRQVQSHSSKSLTNFKTIASSKQSMAKVKSSIHNAKKKVKPSRSLSEGSIHVHKKSSKNSTRRSQDRVTSYKNYLDAALDKLQTQITRKLQTVLTGYRETSTSKPLVTLYHSDTNNTTRMLLPNTKHSHCKTNIGTNPSPTMISPEDIIDSEEVEIDSSDFEGRSSLSQICFPASSDCNYTSEVSSYNTEGSNFTRGSAGRYEQQSSHENHVTQEDKIENTCGIALVTQAILPERNPSGYNRKHSKKKTYENSNSSLKDLKKSSTVIETSSFSDRKHGTLGAHSYVQSSHPKHSSSPSSGTIYEHHTPHRALSRESSNIGCPETCLTHQQEVANNHPDKPCGLVRCSAENTHGSYACEEDCQPGGVLEAKSAGGVQIQRSLSHEQRTSTAQDVSQLRRVICTSDRCKSHAASRTSTCRIAARPCYHKSSSKQSLRSVQRTKCTKYPQSRSSRKLVGSSTSTQASRDPCDRRFHHHKFPLCTIEEENEYVCDPALKALCEYNCNSVRSLTEGWKNAGSSLMNTQRCLDWQSVTKLKPSVSNRITASGCEDILGHIDPSDRNIYKPYNDDLCECRQDQSQLQLQYQPQLQHYDDFRFKDSVYEDSCMKQTCGDCPKKRYYSQILPPYKENHHRHHHNEKYNDKLYRYMQDVPLYRPNREHGNKLLNIVSFVVFLIIFYGIFQYIDFGVSTGKFP